MRVDWHKARADEQMIAWREGLLEEPRQALEPNTERPSLDQRRLVKRHQATRPRSLRERW